MRLALENLLSVPDEAPEVDGQLHACLAALADLVAQHPQVLLKLQTGGHPQRWILGASICRITSNGGRTGLPSVMLEMQRRAVMSGTDR